MVLDNYPNIKQMFQAWSFLSIMFGSVVFGSFGRLFINNILAYYVWLFLVGGSIAGVCAAFYKNVLWNYYFKNPKILRGREAE